MNQGVAKLISQINDLLDFLEVIGERYFLDLRKVLSLKKSLLSLKLLILSRLPQMEGIVVSKKPLELAAEKLNLKKKEVQGKILEFIKQEGEVDSLQIFSVFTNLSRRNIKRHINYMLGEGFIKKRLINKNKILYNANT